MGDSDNEITYASIFIVSHEEITDSAKKDELASLASKCLNLEVKDIYVEYMDVETVVLLTRKNGGGYQVEIDIPIDCDESGELAKEEKATYSNIKKYIYDKFGVNVHTNHIAQIKRACGMDMRECYHKSKKENPWIDVCTPEKAEYIKDALRYYNVI